ncbi:MFS transporter [Subtercola boreus]|uniref:MFS transporter n=1 Tax=Subtercola boreus TaxID=120213 RepID=A0A3E0VEL6_9MICO|nr:MFS transporter [Subtercola boreus]RFA08181.1 MFS transporter [Subtercola boreus]TQL54928.1 EmrB/QacA subfamily drug resistance transporter [Subtercola boreus]
MALSPLRLRLLVVSLLTVSFIGALDNTVVSTSLATIAGDLGALQHLGWVIVGYTLASTVTLPIIGKLGDLFGPRAVFLASLVVFVAASFACGLASSMAWLIVARVVQGMSSAGLQLMSQTIVARVTSPRERPRLMAIIGAAFPIAILVGPVLGGLIADTWGWPWIFWINIPIGFAAFALALFAVPHVAPGVKARFDFAGAASLTVALTALVLAVTWIGDPALGSPSVLAFAVSALAFIVFFVVEFRVADPLVPLRVFANRTVAAGVAISAIIGVGLFSITSYLPTYFQMTYGLSATASGLVPIATVFGMLVSNLLTGWLASRTGHYRPFPLIGTALGAGGLFVMSVLPAGLPLWVPMVVMAVVGVGTGAFMSLIVAVVQSAVSDRETGTITSTVNLVRQVGSTVATAVIGGVVGFGVAALLPAGLDASTLTPQLVQGSGGAVQAEVAAIYHDVFSPVFLALAITYGVGIVASVLLPAGRLSAERVAEPEPLAV